MKAHHYKTKRKMARKKKRDKNVTRQKTIAKQ